MIHLKGLQAPSYRAAAQALIVLVLDVQAALLADKFFRPGTLSATLSQSELPLESLQDLQQQICKLQACHACIGDAVLLIPQLFDVGCELLQQKATWTNITPSSMRAGAGTQGQIAFLRMFICKEPDQGMMVEMEGIDD